MDVDLLKPIEFYFKIFEIAGLREYSCIFIHFICYEGFLAGALANLFIVKKFWKISELLYVIIRVLQLNLIIFKILRDFNKIEELAEKVKDVIRFAHDDRYGDRNTIKKELFVLYKMQFLHIITTLIFVVASGVVTVKYGDLPFPLYNPLDLENSKSFGFAVFYQGLTLFFGIVIMTSFNNLSLHFITIPTGLLKEVEIRLELMEESQEIDQYELMKTVEIYRMIRKLIFEIQSSFGATFFVNSIFNTLILGCLVFVIVDSNEFSNQLVSICLCFPITLEIFIPCYIGQSMINVSEVFKKSFFKSKWISELDWKILRMICRENKEKCLKYSFRNLYNLSSNAFIYSMIAVIFLFYIICQMKIYF